MSKSFLSLPWPDTFTRRKLCHYHLLSHTLPFPLRHQLTLLLPLRSLSSLPQNHWLTTPLMQKPVSPPTKPLANHATQKPVSPPVTPWTVPPRKWSPPDCPRQNNRSPRTKYRSHTWSPHAADGPPCCRLRPCLCHSACIWRTTWTLPVRSKQGEATSAEVSAGGGDDTTPTEEESA